MVPLAPGARLLAVTSVSFDISVLEILWVLSRGATSYAIAIRRQPETETNHPEARDGA